MLAPSPLDFTSLSPLVTCSERSQHIDCERSRRDAKACSFQARRDRQPGLGGPRLDLLARAGTRREQHDTVADDRKVPTHSGGPSSRRSVTLGRLITRSPEPPSPPRASAQSGDDCTQNGCLAGGDPLGGDGIGKGGVQLVDAVTFPVEALSQVCNGRPQLLDGTFEGADGPGADNLVFLPAFPVLTGFVQGGQAPGQHHHCRPAAASASGGPGAARTPAMSPGQWRARHRSCGGRRRRPQG